MPLNSTYSFEFCLLSSALCLGLFDLGQALLLFEPLHLLGIRASLRHLLLLLNLLLDFLALFVLHAKRLVLDRLDARLRGASTTEKKKRKSVDERAIGRARHVRTPSGA